MKERLILAVIGLLTAGCVQQNQPLATNAGYPTIPPSIAAYTLTQSDTKVVEQGVRNSLKDPASAMFGHMKAAKRTDGLITVCGSVNARNSFGGYVGMEPFMGLLTLSPVHYFGVTSMGGRQSATEATRILCQRAGVNI